MIVTRRSPFTGVVHQMDLPITQEQVDAWQSGTLIQHAFPDLTADQREFLLTGITPDEWADTFGEG